MEGENGNGKREEKRETAALTHLHGMGQVGYGQACIAVLETAGKGKSLGLLARAIVYHAYLGAFLCMDFIQLQSKTMISEMLKT
jgi:hypothetical protein